MTDRQIDDEIGDYIPSLQKGEDSTRRNKLMTYMQYIPQSCRGKKNNINYTATISINYTTIVQFSIGK
jgi:hypothetical protein